MKQILFIFFLLLVTSCSSSKNKNTITVTTASSGLVKSSTLNFPLYLTNKIIAKKEIVNETGDDVLLIHTGHLLLANATKKENEQILESLTNKSIDLVNLSLEDFIIANQQGIFFEKYPQQFLNSSVIDLNEDNIVSKKNIVPYYIHKGVALIGLSDKQFNKNLKHEKFLVSDYVLAVLRAKKLALKDPKGQEDPEEPLQSFILIHQIGPDINEVLERLPPNFINSLAD